VLTLCADMEPVRSDNRTPCMIKISGLAGGHSGLDIDKYRANAVKIAAEVLDRIRKEFPSAQIGSVMGGDKRNALAREANMLLFLAEPQVQAVASLLGELQQEYLVEYGDNEPLLSIAMHALAEAPEEHAALKAQDLDRLVTLILGLPHGVIKTSHTMDNMVETSNNVASVKMERSGAACEVAIQCATRSSIGPALERVRRSIRRLGEALGATVAQNDAYPGWKPNPSAKVVQLCRDSITETCGQVPELKAIHAGLECGILGQRIPGVECVSFGPTIRGAHSPDERLQISTVQPFWTSTLALLQKLASGT
jgi:dipeptidase D